MTPPEPSPSSTEVATLRNLQPFIKLCGFTHPDDLGEALELDIEAVGIVLADDAKVRLSEQQVRDLLEVDRNRILAVAVVGNMDLDSCRRVAGLGFDAIQWVPGEDDLTDSRFLTKDRVGCPIIPVVFDAGDAVTRCRKVQQLARANGTTIAETLCIDGARGGGRGEPPDWVRAAAIASEIPLMLAGGLRPESVAEAIAAVRPRAVDVSSGIEGPDGRKNPERMRAFVAAVRGLC